jgi:two-component system sensor histidine kinase KdpD
VSLAIEATFDASAAAANNQSRQQLLAIVYDEYDQQPLVRSVRRLADALGADWIVLYIASLHSHRQRLHPNVSRTLALARELGGDVITTSDHDPVAATLRIARQHKATQLIVGRPARRTFGVLPRRSFLTKLLRSSGDLGVIVVPLESSAKAEPPILSLRHRIATIRQYFAASGVILLVTIAGFLFTPLVGAHATALVYLLAVVLLALFFERGPTLAAATMSAILWDYFFLPPVFAFAIHHFEDAMLFGMYFVVALILGNLTTRIRAQETAERARETRATALYLLTCDLNESPDFDQMTRRIVQQLGSSFKTQVALLLPGAAGLLEPCTGATLEIPSAELAVAKWAFDHRQNAGNLTPHFPSATALYLPLVATGAPLGVLALKPSHPVGWTQGDLVHALCQQIALALDRRRLSELSEKTRILAESERLSKTLLDSMSHEIRTPIAAIKSATGNLAELRNGDDQTRASMIAEIQEATDRLNRLVGNVLEAGRLESGALKPRLTECDVRELIQVAVQELEKELLRHHLTLIIQPDLPVFPMDFVLMQQALTNLLSNAALHTPSGTSVEILARIEGNTLLLTVADRGPGIPPESLSRIFDKFYRVPNSRTGGTGLGLSLVKGFVEAHGGRVTASNRPGGGMTFEIRLPRALHSDE